MPCLGERCRSHPAASGAGEARLRDARGLERTSAALRSCRHHPPLHRVLRAAPRRLGGRDGRRDEDPQGRGLGQGARVGAPRGGAPRVSRQVARADRRRHPLSPALRRPLGHRGRAAHVRASQPRDLTHETLAGGPRLHGGRHTGVPPDPGRRDREAVRDASQRARPRPVLARRARALPQEARGRRVREGVRARAGVPQRRHLTATQPRVHHARALRGLRRLRRHHAARRGAGGIPGDRDPRHDEDLVRRSRPRPHAAVAAGDDGRPRRGADRRARRLRARRSRSCARWRKRTACT